jgi:hypothetical protein
MLQVYVTRLFAQHHCDVSERLQTQARAICPEALAGCLLLGGGDAVLWQWQGVQGFLHSPCYEQMDISVGSLEQATEMSGHDLDGAHRARAAQVLHPGKRACLPMSQPSPKR